MFKGSVLFICPAFFGYEIAITKALEFNGYSVDYIDERPSNNSFSKAIFRIKKDLLNKQISSYYKSVEEKLAHKKYDYLFIIKGEVVPISFIENFKEKNPNAKLIYYTYDSINNNNKNSIFILQHFDKCFSFDFEDVKKFPILKQKHLFFTDEFLIEGEIPQKKHDVSFVGTLHSNRFSVMKKLFSYFKKTFVFYYMPARWFFYFEKLTKKEFKPISISDVSFNKISRAEVATIFKASRSVLDIQRFGQTGLTMRTFEVLASGAVLITTNPYIEQADFYNADNILILQDLTDEKSITEISEKAVQDVESIRGKSAAFEKYYVNNWVNEFFE
ncbi:lipopolysaccharide biosynthesis protein [Pedobacter petrophilus]|uniref:Lipopolysaccharide biosynthesis protein n=1 Tax=Pedobacter petrophilus TaxID=1908241 RepID=A0A7K0G314_9SPHI|nr:lipopolysaccharide biosynthesis protein [Pedobacter petrophilus]MRX78203.1 lipopolysaccharide biosynthesis protein [Pedobacter petrophilus]